MIIKIIHFKIASFKLVYDNIPKPSPIPKMTLKKMSAYIDFAKNGVMKVDNDHINTASVKMFFPPYFLAALPPIT